MRLFRRPAWWSSSGAGPLAATAMVLGILLIGDSSAFARPQTSARTPEAQAINALVEKGELKEAERLARALIGALERDGKGDSIECADALDLLVDVLDKKDVRTLREVAVARHAAEVRLRAEGESTAYANMLHTYARWLHWMGLESESRVQHEAALAARQRLLEPDHPDIGTSFNSLGTIAARLGEWEAARTYYERALEIMVRSRGFNRRETRVVLHNLAELQDQMGDYESVRDLYARLVDDMERRPDPTPLVITRALSWIGEMDSRLGDDTQALKSYERARETWFAALRQPEALARVPLEEQANTLTRLATTAKAVGQVQQAREFYVQGLEIRERLHGENHHAVAWNLRQLAELLHDQGDSAEARPYIDRACRILSDGGPGSPDQLVACLGLQGTILRELGEVEAARGIIERALAAGQKAIGVGHPDFWQILGEQARLSMVAGRLEDARRQALRAEGLAARHFRRTAAWLSQGEALRYDKERLSGLDLALSVLAATSQGGSSSQAVEATWDAVIRSRGIVLDELIARRRVASIATDGSIEALVRRLEADRSRLAHAVVSGPGDRDSSGNADELRSLMKHQEATERELASSSAAFRRLLADQDSGLAQVRNALPQQTALVAYVRYSRFQQYGNAWKETASYLAFVKAAPGGRPEVVHLGEAALIDSLVARWRDSAATPPPRGLDAGGAPGVEASTAAGDRLRRAIWDPIERLLGSGGAVLVVPDGTLNQVNLAALPGTDGRFLVESSRVFHYLSAEKDLLRESRSPKGRGLLALGAPDFDSRVGGGVGRIPPASHDGATRSATSSMPLLPLQQAREEVEQLAALWNARGHVAPGEEALLLTGGSATEDRLKRQVGGKQVVHLATHGFSETETAPRHAARGNPLLASGLALAGANACLSATSDCDGQDDGILLGEEILSLNLSGVEWVVLSACNTGLGIVQAREGVQGLRRSFQGAGAATVITTLWNVEDRSTRDWMSALYDARLRGLTTAESMRQASLDMIAEARRNNRAPHPYFWGGFVAFGDWR